MISIEYENNAIGEDEHGWVIQTFLDNIRENILIDNYFRLDDRSKHSEFKNNWGQFEGHPLAAHFYDAKILSKQYIKPEDGNNVESILAAQAQNELIRETEYLEFVDNEDKRNYYLTMKDDVFNITDLEIETNIKSGEGSDYIDTVPGFASTLPEYYYSRYVYKPDPVILDFDLEDQIHIKLISLVNNIQIYTENEYFIIKDTNAEVLGRDSIIIRVKSDQYSANDIQSFFIEAFNGQNQYFKFY